MNQHCKVLCRHESLNKRQATAFKARISDEYRVNMILDNLPIGMVRMREDQGNLVKTYERGFPVGYMDVSGW